MHYINYVITKLFKRWRRIWRWSALYFFVQNERLVYPALIRCSQHFYRKAICGTIKNIQYYLHHAAELVSQYTSSSSDVVLKSGKELLPTFDCQSRNNRRLQFVSKLGTMLAFSTFRRGLVYKSDSSRTSGLFPIISPSEYNLKKQRLRTRNTSH